MDKKWILLILLIASLLRLYGLNQGDTVNDEVFTAFRAVSLVDFNEAEFQTTPWEWFDPHIPGWAKLSFHDHPPLVFWVQHFFIKIFGENNFAFRFPSAILGILSVWLLYLLGRKMFSQKVGLLSAAVLAATLNHVYISRVGMQESYVIFFILLASYFFLKAVEREKYFLWTGLALGLGFLTKYTAFVLIPIFLVYLVLFNRGAFRKKFFWLGILLVTAIFSPVIIYNLKMYQAVGHFDFQFSYVFNQPHPEWNLQPGKEIGSLAERLENFVPRTIASNSWSFLFLAGLALLSGLILFIKEPKKSLLKYGFLAISLVFLFLLLLKIGPSYRFLTMLAPFLALTVGIFLNFLAGKTKKYFLIPLILILGFEVFYSINNQIFYYPKGISPWFSSKVRYENYNWGYNELDKYLKQEFKGQMPALTFEVKYRFLEELRDKALREGLAQKLVLNPFLIVYGGNFDDGAKLWVMERRFVYHAWPVLRAEDYLRYLREEGEDYYDRSGFSRQYFVMPANFVPLPEINKKLAGVVPLAIKNPRGDIVFLVFKFSKEIN